MKATLTFEGKTVEVEITEEEARKIFAEPKKTGWERAEVGEYYRYIYISTGAEAGTRADDARYQEGQYISSYDLAFDQIRAIKLWLRIKRWAAEHCEPVAFKPESGRWRQKYGIQWALLGADGEHEIRPAIQDSTRQFGNVYLDTKEHAEKCIEEFRDELTWYFTECRDRMDG